MNRLFLAAVLSVSGVFTARPAWAAAPRPNVLFIAIDDQNDWIGHLGGHPLAKTPHIDRLAARGTAFLNAHIQSPLCNPCRTSLMLGLRPTTTGVYGLAPWFRTLPKWRDRVALPQHFALHGYRTLGTGKIYHGGTGGGGGGRAKTKAKPGGQAAAPPEFQDRIDFIRRRLPGQELQNDSVPVGLLNILPTNEWVLKQYVSESYDWSTVTPVILPGHDDRDSRKAEELLRKAFAHAGVSQTLIDSAELSWRQVGYLAGLDLAKNYIRPRNLNGPTYHVRVNFTHKIKGPLAIGAGRYRGLGLFAAEEDKP